MKITQKIIDDLTVALAHTKKDGTENWKDGDEIDVCLAGTFAADKFITLINHSFAVLLKRNASWILKRKSWRSLDTMKSSRLTEMVVQSIIKLNLALQSILNDEDYTKNYR